MGEDEYKKVTIIIEDSTETVTVTADKVRMPNFEPIVRPGRNQKIWENPDYVMFEPDEVVGLKFEFLTDPDDRKIRYTVHKSTV